MADRTCGSCGAEVPGIARFCPMCAAAVPDRQPGGLAFGSAVDGQSAAGGSPVMAAPPAVAQATATAPVVAYPAAAAPTPAVQAASMEAATVAPPAGNVVRLKGRHIALIAGLVALVLIGTIAAGAMTAPKPKPAGELVGQLPFGPEGGTQEFDGGNGKMKVPKGALSKPETIIVRRTVVRERVQAQSFTGAPLIFPPGALIAYTFGPITVVLNAPITITLRLPAVGQAGIVFVTANGQIQFFPGDVGGRTIRFRITTFDLNQPGAIVAV